MWETFAGAFMRIRERFGAADDGEAMLTDAEENLEACRNSLLARERDLSYQCDALARTALAKKKAGDAPGARFVLQVPDRFDPLPLLRRLLGPCLELL